MKRIRDTSIEDKFYRNVHVGDQYECWPWLGSVNGAGYGQLTHKGIHRTAHRVAYELFHGPITERDVAHRCDNRLCCSPWHLFQCTRSTNMKDAVAKSRISRLMLKNKQAAEARLMSKADIAKEREARIAAGCPTSADLSSIRMKGAVRDEFGRRIVPGQQLKPRERGYHGRFNKQ